MYTATAEAEAAYRTKCIEAVQAVVKEPVIGAFPFSRRGLYTQKLLGRFGFVPWLLGRAFAKQQAGGLPETFMLAITPTQVRGFKYKARGRMRDQYEIGDEVAVWAREALSVSWQPGPPYQTDVTIESAGEGETVLCRCGRGDSSEAFLQVMADPTATA